MKRYILYLTSAACLFCLSCSDFLTEELQGDYSTKTFYTSSENAVRAVNGIYNISLFTREDNLLWVFGDVASDDSIKGGNPGDKSDINYIDNFSADPDNGMLSIYWIYSYEGIARANNAIKYIPDIKNMDSALKDRLIGEAKFLRALNYFHLVNIWGAIPLRTEPNTATNGNLPLSDVAAVYTLIEQDLKDAINSAIPISYSAQDAGRVTKGAAYAMLAKVYLFRNNWGGSLSAIESVNALNKYDLADNYGDLFVPGAEDNKEVIFAARHLQGQNPGLGNILNVYFAPSPENGYYFNAPTQSYVDSFNETTVAGEVDPRLDISIGRPGQPWMNGNTFEAGWSPTGYLVKKYNQPLAQVPVGTKADGYLPYIYLRYADVLLMKAEALAQRNTGTDFDDACDALDEVRARAGLAPTTAATQSELLKAIRIERRRELGFESHRFFDLMRWGKEIAVEALGSEIEVQWRGDRFYYPIPQGELDTNKGIKQEPTDEILLQ